MATEFEKINYFVAGGSTYQIEDPEKAPIVHATTADTYGLSSTTKYGHTKLTNTPTSEYAEGVALSGYGGYYLQTQINSMRTGWTRSALSNDSLSYPNHSYEIEMYKNANLKEIRLRVHYVMKPGSSEASSYGGKKNIILISNIKPSGYAVPKGTYYANSYNTYKTIFPLVNGTTPGSTQNITIPFCNCGLNSNGITIFSGPTALEFGQINQDFFGEISYFYE